MYLSKLYILKYIFLPLCVEIVVSLDGFIYQSSACLSSEPRLRDLSNPCCNIHSVVNTHLAILPLAIALAGNRQQIKKQMDQASWQLTGNLHKNIWARCLLLWNSTSPEYWCSTTLTVTSTCRLHYTAELWTVTRQRRKQLPLTEASKIPLTSRWKKCDGADYQHRWMLTRTSIADPFPGEFVVAIKGPIKRELLKPTVWQPDLYWLPK